MFNYELREELKRMKYDDLEYMIQKMNLTYKEFIDVIGIKNNGVATSI